jgi:asparagine synthase (glutamine-hydrolysing)
MCGIAGVLIWDDRFRVTREGLEGMSACIAHRGPDDAGIYFNHDSEASADRPRIALAHRRLAILDLDARAKQPLTDQAGRWIVLNGEIYNFRDLREELTGLRPEYQWRTTGDTEVLLLAYAVWGRKCLDRLNGMYAFAIWDEGAGELFLARDRMGQKPLYYAHKPGGAFAFASEPTALRALPWVETTLDMQALVDYLTWGFCPRGTIYQSIQKLSPGYCMRVNAKGVECERYFDPNPSINAGGETEDATARTRELVTTAVQRQLVADVPVGCFLSGGMDSSIVAAAMRAVASKDQPVLTFAIGFDDPRYDETPYAAAVAKHLGTTHHQFIVRPDAAEELPKLAAAFGEPFADSSALPTHYLSRETRQHVKVALSGDGGDELFGGYERYRAMRLGERLRTLPQQVLKVTRLLARLPGAHPKSKLARLKRFVATMGLKPAARYASYLRLFDESEIAALLQDNQFAMRPMVGEYAHPTRLSERALTDQFDALLQTGRDVVESAMAADRVFYLPEDLLTKVDRCSMFHALEVRSPFMDHELVHFAARLSTKQLIGHGPKTLLRKAFAADLPGEVFKRRKMGFAVPIGDWFRNELREMLRDTLTATDSFAAGHFNAAGITKLIDEHESNKRDHSQRLYALLMMELWWRKP